MKEPKYCCSGNCQQGRSCPHRPAQPPTRREWIVTAGALVVALLASFFLTGGQ